MRLRSTYLLFCMLLPLGGNLSAQESDWPKEIATKDGAIIVYQPQVEKFQDNRFEARTAIALKLNENPGKPIFGAIWMTARVHTSRDANKFTIQELQISDVRFADDKQAEKQTLSKFLQGHLATSDFTASLELLLTDFDIKKDKLTKSGLKHNPPNIIFSTKPAVLVSFDGKPIIQDIDDTKLQQVVNTPFFIVKSGPNFYLSGGDNLWYQSPNELGPWQLSNTPPNEVTRLAKKNDTKKARQSNDQPIPHIITATEPSELIVSTGKPSWSPVEDMNLLYMDNSNSDVFLELSTQYYYTLLSGRWYRTTALDQQWQHIPNDELPKAFADIKSDSVNAHVLSQVAGTQQARTAILDNTIPQTSAIRRDNNSMTVQYDGRPKFTDVEKMRIQYAVNTESAVFKVNNHYYLADQGVWYDSSSPTGPWVVATSVPTAIYDIPPSNPHYNVTYVRIYDVTPNIVYVGYTPGYMHSYYYHGTVVYGTGWYYPPWHHSAYYPRPWTWGLRVSYNPWIGWGFGLGWADSLYFNHGHHPHYQRHYAWYGPGGYRPHYRPHAGKDYNKHNSRPDRMQHGPQKVAMHANIYNSPNNIWRNIEHSVKRHKGQAQSTRHGKNNVYTDKHGNIYRREKNGQWKPTTHFNKARTSNRHQTPAQQRTHSTKTHEKRHDKRNAQSQHDQHRPKHSKQQQSHVTGSQLERNHGNRNKGSQRVHQNQWPGQSQQHQSGGRQHHAPANGGRH